jgi:hypothetical protein
MTNHLFNLVENRVRRFTFVGVIVNREVAPGSIAQLIVHVRKTLAIPFGLIDGLDVIQRDRRMAGDVQDTFAQPIGSAGMQEGPA